MKITLVDWLVVAAYFRINLLIGLYYRKKAGAVSKNVKRIASVKREELEDLVFSLFILDDILASILNFG